MYSTSEFRKGLKIEIDGDLYEIVDFEHHKPGKGSAIVRTRIKNLKDGRVIDRTFRSGDKVNKPDFEQVEVQYLYSDGEVFHFMNTSNYEQIELRKEFLGEQVKFLQENLPVAVLFFNGKPITAELPNFVKMKVVRTEPGFRGDTATGAAKPATMESGAIVMVPLFINEGDLLKVDTRTGDYVERVNK